MLTDAMLGSARTVQSAELGAHAKNGNLRTTCPTLAQYAHPNSLDETSTGEAQKFRCLRKLVRKCPTELGTSGIFLFFQ